MVEVAESDAVGDTVYGLEDIVLVLKLVGEVVGLEDCLAILAEALGELDETNASETSDEGAFHSYGTTTDPPPTVTCRPLSIYKWPVRSPSRAFTNTEPSSSIPGRFQLA
jgi:hypothetical protein